MGKEELYKDSSWLPENMVIVPKLAVVEQKHNENSSYCGGGMDWVVVCLFVYDSGRTGGHKDRN